MPFDSIEHARGFEKLTGLFGPRPSFHDAEILKVVFDRGPKLPSMELTIHILCDQDAPHTLLTIHFGNIQLDRFEDFNHQNVIDDLMITQNDADSPRFAVDIPGNNGLYAAFRCDSIEVINVEEYSVDRRIRDGSVYAER